MKELLEDSFSRLCMIMKRFISFLFKLFYPKSPIGKAIHSTYGISRELIPYTIAGGYCIDKIRAENNVRDLTLERKKSLFCGNHEAAGRTVIILSFMASCNVNRIHPQERHTDVLNRIQDHNFQKSGRITPTSVETESTLSLN